MTQLLKLAQVNTNGVQNQDLTTLEIVGQSFTFGGASGTNVTKTIIDLLISNTHAPMSDNQNVVAGNGLTGGGSSATVNLAVQASDLSIISASGGVSVNKDPAGAIQVGASGIFVGTDGFTLEINSNALRVKDLGITTGKIALNAIESTRLASDVSIDANRAVNTNHIRDAAVTNAKIASGVDALKIGSGLVDNTEFSYLDGVTSSIQTQLNSKQATLTIGNLSAPGTDGISVTSGTGAVIGSGTSISQQVADTTHNGYLSSTDWNTFNNKQNTLTYVDASTYLASGLAASTPITLPGSASFNSATAADIGIIVNGIWKEITRDFTTVGSAPYTQIQFNYTLPNDSVLRVKQVK